MTSPISAFPADNPYGKLTIAGMKTLVSDRRLRRVAHGRKEFFHRTKNGVYDPLTYFHVLDALLELVPGKMFRTADFVAFLEATRDQMVWDTTTVGRVVNDIAETLQEANGRAAIESARRWNGMIYSVTEEAEGRSAMVHLLDDLYKLAEDLIASEATGKAPKRINSPLLLCGSVMRL
jgi:hypothetical protein